MGIVNIIAQIMILTALLHMVVKAIKRKDWLMTLSYCLVTIGNIGRKQRYLIIDIIMLAVSIWYWILQWKVVSDTAVKKDK